MSVSESRPESAPTDATQLRDELGSIQADAGALLARHHGRVLALSYGSAAGELAACLNAVGVASRAELTKFELTAPGPNLERVIAGLLGVPLLPGGMHQTRAVGWYRPDGGRLIALCEAEQAERLRGRLEFWMLRDPAVALHDRTDEWSGSASTVRAAIREPCRRSPGPRTTPRPRGYCTATTTPWRSRPVDRPPHCGDGSRKPAGRCRSAPSVTRRSRATKC